MKFRARIYLARFTILPETAEAYLPGAFQPSRSTAIGTS
jgi:hypothetical protein